MTRIEENPDITLPPTTTEQTPAGFAQVDTTRGEMWETPFGIGVKKILNQKTPYSVFNSFSYAEASFTLKLRNYDTEKKQIRELADRNILVDLLDGRQRRLTPHHVALSGIFLTNLSATRNLADAYTYTSRLISGTDLENYHGHKPIVSHHNKYHQPIFTPDSPWTKLPMDHLPEKYLARGVDDDVVYAPGPKYYDQTPDEIIDEYIGRQKIKAHDESSDLNYEKLTQLARQVPLNSESISYARIGITIDVLRDMVGLLELHHGKKGSVDNLVDRLSNVEYRNMLIEFANIMEAYPKIENMNHMRRAIIHKAKRVAKSRSTGGQAE